MQYILTPTWEEGANQLAEKLNDELKAGKKVLWLLSGGSNIPISISIINKINAGDTKNLTITLVDERFGDVAHADSNWQQLINAGFAAKQATLIPILQQGLDFEETTKYFKEKITKALSSNEVIVAQVGMGDDGHILGVLPDSPAITEGELVCGYQNQPYPRITMTLSALRRVSSVFVFAFGDSKKPALLKLQQQKLPPSQQPAQILKDLPDVFLYNDQVGEKHD